MRKTLLAIPLCFALVGCAGTDLGNKASGIAANIATASREFNEKVSLARAYTRDKCNYVPTVASIISLFNSSLGAAVGTVGEAVCEAVRSAPLADGPANFRVNGVLVKGRFVR